MNKKLINIISSLLLINLTSCVAKDVSHDISEYVINVDIEDKSEFKILQLTDIHMANKDERNRQYDILTKTINLANPDMIVITGDIFTFGTKKLVKEIADFFDSFGVYWTLTFGNHDEQCYFSIDWLTNYLNNYGSKCLFKDIQDDDITGNANFAINLNKNNKIFEQLIVMDSNRYNYGEYVGYDYIKESQINWYENLVDYTTNVNGSVANSMLFFHIPLPEWNDAWEGYENGSPDSIYIMGEKNEKVCCPDYNSGFFDKILEKQSTDAITVGHDHINSFVIKYKGVYLSYGVTSTDRIYHKKDLIGGRLITIKDDHSYVFEDVLTSYEEAN